MCRYFLRVTTTLVVWGSAPLASGDQHFNLSQDFSLTNNPTGPWAYLQGAAPIASQLDGFISELHGWGYYGSLDASIMKLTSPPTIGWHDAEMADVVMHAASEGFGPPVAIRWIAPQSGTISIYGGAWDAFFFAERDAGWTLSLNGTLLAARNTIVGTFRTDTAAAFHNNAVAGQSLCGISITQGDELIFSTYHISYYGHFIGVDLTVDLNSCAPGIASHPRSALSCTAGVASFSVVAPCNGPHMYQWQIETSPGMWQGLGNDPFPLPCGGFAFASPINSPTVNIGVHDCPGPFRVRCVVSNGCGIATSRAATLTPYAVLPGDVNGDGFVDADDIQEFVSRVPSGGASSAAFCAADMNHSGAVDEADVPLFVAALLGS